jgi:hypothetical protein
VAGVPVNLVVDHPPRSALVRLGDARARHRPEAGPDRLAAPGDRAAGVGR